MGPHTSSIFDAQFNRGLTSTSGSTSASGKSSSSGHQLGLRHQVAEPPNKERTKSHSRHLKSEDGSKTTLGISKSEKHKKSSVSPVNMSASSSEVTSQPTNVLRVEKKKTVRPYRSIQPSSSSSTHKTSSTQKTTSSLFDIKSQDHTSTPSSNAPPPTTLSTNSTPSSNSSSVTPSSHGKIKKSHSFAENYSSSSSSLKQSTTDSQTSSSSLQQHKKKYASVHPNVNPSSSEKQQLLDTKIVLPIRKTSSAQSFDQSHNSIQVALPVKSGAGETTKKKEKKPKKTKKGKEKPPALQAFVKSQPITSEGKKHVTSSSEHVTSIQSHVTPIPVKPEPPLQSEPIIKTRPGNLKITNPYLLEEASTDTGDVQSMLQEMLNPLPSLLTPIITPVKKKRPFDFPSRPVGRHFHKASCVVLLQLLVCFQY